MKGKTKKSVKTGVNTDVIMGQLWLRLQSDLSSACGETLCAKAADTMRQALRTGDFSEVRSHEIPGNAFLLPTYTYKCMVQLYDFFKRYRFGKDLYSDYELHARTNALFLAVQEKLAVHREWKLSTRLVLQRARALVKEILGEYSPDVHNSLCRFGKRASLGHPASNSYLDSKLVDGFITGHVKQLKWFEQDHLPVDHHLLGAIKEGGCPFLQRSDCLRQTNVPKSFKIHRGIMPNTLVGTYYTYGLGRYIQAQLKNNAGLDITKLQRVHGDLARLGSIRGHLVTADLSNASHSFTSRLVKTLVPLPWYRALDLGRITKFEFAETSAGGFKGTYAMSSFMAMGIGFTFPLQTLLFYAIIRAVQALTGMEGGRVSVYGDDLIYPTRIHKHVVAVLTDIGFELNVDKTFVRSQFRESCGQDFLRGIDVRPFRYEGVASRVHGQALCSLCYKLANGLLRRWDASEIQSALYYLLVQIASRSTAVFVVPDHFPDYSGMRISKQVLFLRSLAYVPWVLPRVTRQGLVKVQHLSLLPSRRRVLVESAYYWDRLRGMAQQDQDLDEFDPWRSYEHDQPVHKQPAFALVVRDKQPKNYRSKVTKRRIKLCDLLSLIHI